MTDENKRTGTRLREVLARLENSQLAPELQDDDERRRKVFELLAAGEAPIARELGQELAAGNVSIRDAAAVPAYREVFDAGLRRLATLDLNAVADELEQAIEAAEAERAADRPVDEPEAEENDVVVRKDAW